MKIRTDFVTNSSSSSFIIAKKKELTDKQKEIIISYVEKNMFGQLIASTKEELDNYYKEELDEDVNDEHFQNSYRYNKYKKAVEALENGMCIYSDWICFEECDYDYASMFTDLWEKLEENDEDNFKGIDTSLDY